MKYFTLQELIKSETADKLGIDNTPSAAIQTTLETLVYHVLDPLRGILGRPLYVNSGYRCPALNKAVGGTSYSQHMRGEAADVTTRNNVGNEHIANILKEKLVPYDQAIIYRNKTTHKIDFVHISYTKRQSLRGQLLENTGGKLVRIR